jgi:hypothetical protein
MGGPQSLGFLIYPTALPAPGEIVGAEALHRVFRGWLSFLGHPEPAHAEAARGQHGNGVVQPSALRHG